MNKLSINDSVTVPGIIEKGVVVLVDALGLVGVESETFINGHGCDGRGKDGHCLYVALETVIRL